jgi:hypothetical protein
VTPAPRGDVDPRDVRAVEAAERIVLALVASERPVASRREVRRLVPMRTEVAARALALLLRTGRIVGGCGVPVRVVQAVADGNHVYPRPDSVGTRRYTGTKSRPVLFWQEPANPPTRPNPPEPARTRPAGGRLTTRPPARPL